MKLYVLLALVVILNAYAQVAMKLGAHSAEGVASGTSHRVWLLITNPWVLSSFVAAFVAAIAWMFAVARLPLSHAYPFLGATFVLVMILGHYVFQEPISGSRAVGAVLIAVGIVLCANS